ncbi:MAG: hypothetical protein ACR2MG_04390 [Pyrinomonadaceae bacterium]
MSSVFLKIILLIFWRLHNFLIKTQVKLLEGLPAEKLYQYEWSPDGKQFAFTRGREVRDVVLISDFR